MLAHERLLRVIEGRRRRDGRPTVEQVPASNKEIFDAFGAVAAKQNRNLRKKQDRALRTV